METDNYDLKEMEKKYNKKYIIYMIKKNWGSGKIKKNLGKLYKDKKYKSEILEDAFPKDPTELFNNKAMVEQLPLEHQLIWASNVIYLHRKEINFFLNLKREFDLNIILGDYNKAINILNRIRNKMGVSYWYYENKLLAYQYKNENKIDQSIYQEIVKEFEENLLGQAIMEQINIRLEKNLSYLQFVKEFNNIIESCRSQDNSYEAQKLFDYIVYKIDPFSEENRLEYSEILNFESHASLIDYYLTFINILNITISKNKLEDIKLVINNVLKTLDNEILDENLLSIGGLFNFNKVSKYLQENANILDIIDCYTIGDYRKCSELCEKYILKGSICNEIYSIYPKCIVKISNEEIYTKFSNSIFNNYMNIKIKVENNRENTQHLLNQLKKISSNLNHMSLGVYIKSLLINEFSSSNLKQTIDYRIINYNIVNPLLYISICEGEKRQRISTLNRIFHESKTVKMYLAILDKNKKSLSDLQLPDERFMKYYSKILIEQKDFKQAIIVLKKLETKSCDVNLNEILKSLIICYLELDMSEESIKIAIEYSLNNNNLYFNFPIMKIIQNIDDQINCYLDIAILYSLYIRTIEAKPEQDKDLYDSLFDYYEEYLDSLDIERPTQLFNYNIDKKIHYFLENICTINIMNNSTEFKDTADLEDERSNILNFLIIHDKEKDDIDNLDKYINEMSNISERRILRKSLIEVGKNKISIDLEKIKIDVNKDMKDKYYKYIHNLDCSINQVEYFIEDLKYGASKDSLRGHIPKDYNINLLYTLIFELRDRFTSSLDCCLGPEIRHGKLVSQLRRTFEKEYLITTKDKNTGSYIKNDYWLEKYSYLDEINLHELNRKLNGFSETLDTLFNDVKDTWIQINNEKVDNGGLFDFAIPINLLESIMNNITYNSSFEEFIEYVFEILWSITIERLDKVKEMIKVDLNKVINDECIVVLKQISKCISGTSKERCPDLYNAIKDAQTEAQYNLDEISEWFNIANELEGKPYRIKHAVNVAREILRGMHPNIEIECKTDIEGNIILARRTLNNFVNIFFTILENSISHKNNSKIDIVLSIRRLKNTPNGIEIIFINNTKSNVEESELLKIKEINKKLKNDVTDEDIKKEGGTGFLKIRKIITIDLNYRVKEIKLLYSKENEFIANIKFDI